MSRCGLHLCNTRPTIFQMFIGWKLVGPVGVEPTIWRLVGAVGIEPTMSFEPGYEPGPGLPTPWWNPLLGYEYFNNLLFGLWKNIGR